MAPHGVRGAAPSATPTSQTSSLAGVAPPDDALARGAAEQRPVIVAFILRPVDTGQSTGQSVTWTLNLAWRQSPGPE
eukprot:8541532-Prorocentrum_lima.AAC.1